ncbi:MAG: hypothetical protein IJU14_06590 [Clostridia bacterium]|nr:hypothetical protein [Clostridia bacterium]
MNIYTVSFFGHRTIENQDDVEIRLEDTIDNILNNNDYVRFLVGYEGEFDLLVAPIIHHCRKKSGKYNNELVLVMPYIRKEYLNYQKSFYQNYDFIEVCSQSSLAYYKQSIVIRNKKMVDRSDLVVCYILRNSGGAYKTVSYAKKLNRQVINIASDRN